MHQCTLEEVNLVLWAQLPSTIKNLAKTELELELEPEPLSSPASTFYIPPWGQMTSTETTYVISVWHLHHPFKANISITNWNPLCHQEITTWHSDDIMNFWWESSHMHLFDWADEVTLSGKVDTLIFPFVHRKEMVVPNTHCDTLSQVPQSALTPSQPGYFLFKNM